MTRIRLTRPLLFVLLAAGSSAPAEAREGVRRHAHIQRRRGPVAFIYRLPTPRLVMPDIMTPPPQLPPLVLVPTFYEYHAGRVQKDFLSFQIALPGEDLSVHRQPTINEEKRLKLSFAAPSTSDDPLQQLRELQRLRLFREPQPGETTDAIAAGLSLFIGAMMGAAHAPEDMRFLFDGPVHVGPAIFQGGGMGAGVGAALP